MSVAPISAALPPRPSFSFLLAPPRNIAANVAPPVSNSDQKQRPTIMVCKSLIYTCACIAVHAGAGATATVLFAGVLLYYDSSDIHNIVAATVAMLITLEQCADGALFLRWAACGAWACLFSAIGAQPAAHGIVVLLGMMLLAPSSWLRDDVQPLVYAILMDQKNSSSTAAVPTCGGYNYLPFIFRTVVYLLLNNSNEEETHRVRMLRYGATLFATNDFSKPPPSAA